LESGYSRYIHQVEKVTSMARIIDGRLLPTFLHASPIEEEKPKWEELMKNLDKTQQRLEHSLQRFKASPSRQSMSRNKERLGISTNEVSKSLYEEFGLEGAKSTASDQRTRDREESTNHLPNGSPKEDETVFTSSLPPYEDLDQEESHIAPVRLQVENKVEKHAKEEPHLDLQAHEERHDSEMVDSIHVG
jgi:hypothetical protein